MACFVNQAGIVTQILPHTEPRGWIRTYAHNSPQSCFNPAYALTCTSLETLPLCAEPLRPLPPGQRPEEACHRVLRNCNQHGDCIKRRDWCLLRGRTPAQLTLRSWKDERRPAYLFGRSEGNPTHVTCLHVLPLLRWMELASIPLGQVGCRLSKASAGRLWLI